MHRDPEDKYLYNIILILNEKKKYGSWSLSPIELQLVGEAIRVHNNNNIRKKSLVILQDVRRNAIKEAPRRGAIKKIRIRVRKGRENGIKWTILVRKHNK